MLPKLTDGGLARLARRAGLWSIAFGLLLVAMVQIVDVEAVGEAMAGLSPALLLVVVGLSFANYALRSLRWHYLCRHVDVNVPLGHNAVYYVAGFAFTVTPGKIGEVVRLWFIKRRHGYGYERTAGLMVMDRLTDAWPLLLLSLLGAAQFAGQGIALLLISAVLVAGSVVMLHPAWIRRSIKLTYARIRRVPHVFARLLRASRPLARFASPAAMSLPMALGLVGWFCEIVGTWLILDALGAPADLTTAAFVFGFSMLVGALPIFPGGVGGAEGTMIGLLVLLGVPLPTAVAATAVVRLVTLGLAVVIGFMVLPFAASLSRPIQRPLVATAG
ncbi:MAG: lysylphosphatidylglycerol synthase transmembrane domain-containing protein [Pseudomonadota bacterium]